jgi:1,4-dihydroxy-2-naphthoyl-CoA hydrolase
MNVAPNQESVTVELKINLIRAIREGTIRATAVPLHRGRSTSIWETHITDQVGHLVAASLSTHFNLAVGAS